MSNLAQLQNLIFQLRFTGKQFEKNSKKCEADQKKELAKLKKAIEKSQTDIARIHAENAIRKKNEGVNFLKLSARMDAVVSRLDTAVKMQQVTKAMGCVVKGFDKVLDQMNPEKVSALMDQFEKQMEDFDANGTLISDAIGGTTANTVPDEDVMDLMQAVAAEHNLNLKSDLGPVSASKIGNEPVAQQGKTDLDDLSSRLAALQAN